MVVLLTSPSSSSSLLRVFSPERHWSWSRICDVLRVVVLAAGGCFPAFQKLTLPISFACRFLVESRRSSRSASWKFSGSSSSYYRSDWQRQAASFLQCWPFCFRKFMSARRRSCCSCAHPKKSHYYLQTRENMRSCCSSKMQMEEWILTSRAAAHAGGRDGAAQKTRSWQHSSCSCCTTTDYKIAS